MDTFAGFDSSCTRLISASLILILDRFRSFAASDRGVGVGERGSFSPADPVDSDEIQ